MGLNRYSSPVLLNWVEPYKISGIEKTLFYTEVNTNFQVGERVFIINGNYDSDLLISADKYKKGRDGYKVLAIDGCKVVLDIDYTGDLPNRGNVKYGDNISDYIGLYYIDSYESYLAACRQVTTRGGLFDDKFNYYQNNIAFIDANYSAITDNWGFVGSALTGTPGFFVKDGKNGWTNITSDFFYSGTYSQAASPLYYNNGKIKVMGKPFTYKGVEFKEGFVYKWENKKWIIEVTEESKYVKAIISKSNFRDGSFKGTFNNGLYGTKSKKIAWTGEGSWNGGTLLNSVWQSGAMNSTISLSKSYKSTLNQYGLPQQKLNGINNNGYGFNYIIDSEIVLSDVSSGTVRNTKIGGGNKVSVVKDHILSKESSFYNVVKNTNFENCEFVNTHMIGGVLNNSIGKNCKFTNVKSINSRFENSVITESTLIGDGSIKILGYDEWCSSNRFDIKTGFSTKNTTNFKVYKFYIGEADFFRLKQGDIFYIRNLKVKDGSKKVLNFFDRKFKIGCWTEYFDDYTGAAQKGIFSKETFYKRGVEHSAFLCTQQENEYIYSSLKANDALGFYTDTISPNPIYEYSIDVFVSMQDIFDTEVAGLNFNYGSETNSSATPKRTTYFGENIVIKDAYIVDSNFDSGIIDRSDWNSGIIINQNNDLTIIPATNSNGYNIKINEYGDLSIKTAYNSIYQESRNIVQVGEILFLNSVEYDTRGKVISLAISASGSSYGENNIVSGAIAPTYAPESPKRGGYGLRVNNTVDSQGGVNGVEIVNHGLGYSVGDILLLQLDGQGDAKIKITSVHDGLVRIPDAYIVSNNDNGTLALSEIVTGTFSVIAGLTAGGIFITDRAENRWGYLSKTKISRSKIKSGLMRRNYISQSVIQDEDYDSSDKDYENADKIKNLVISDHILKDGKNILSSATYLNSHLVGGSDIWDDGIIQNSLINGITFAKGTVKESIWIDGTFNGGVFYDSKSFDGNSSETIPYFYTNGIKSYHINGITSATLSNSRHSWQSGTFNGGYFFKSNWEGGVFNGGVFYNSKWYDGVFNGGIIGDIGTPAEDTALYGGTINNATVENATLLSKNVNYYPYEAKIIWNNGVFNRGIFGSDQSAYSVWNDGVFNGGQFVDYAVWKNGTFNGGQFTSTYGWTVSGIYSSVATSSSYSWQDGVFNGGEFGNASKEANSTWYIGEFNGGVFKGRVWNFGIFTSGEFSGSGGVSTGGTESANAGLFVDSYISESFYGLWRDGLLTDKKDIFITDKKFSTIVRRGSDIADKNTYASFNNALWLGGEFNHNGGKFINSVWLGGRFSMGEFTSSSFNPYVKRIGQSQPAFNTDDSTCLWLDGKLSESEFYYSLWYSGQFISGTAYGMIFKSGTSNYMNANNIYWESGTWKNGNWNGSSFEYSGKITSDFAKKTMTRVAEYGKDTKYHIWNIFEDIKEKNVQLISNRPSIPVPAVANITPTGSTNSYPPVDFTIQVENQSTSDASKYINPAWLNSINNTWNTGGNNTNIFDDSNNS